MSLRGFPFWCCFKISAIQLKILIVKFKRSWRAWRFFCCGTYTTLLFWSHALILVTTIFPCVSGVMILVDTSMWHICGNLPASPSCTDSTVRKLLPFFENTISTFESTHPFSTAFSTCTCDEKYYLDEMFCSYIVCEYEEEKSCILG